MKNYLMAALVSTLLACTTLSGSAAVVSVNELTPELFDDFQEGRLEGTAVEFSAGTAIPLQLFVHGDLLALEGAEGHPLCIKVLKTFYVKSGEGGSLFSFDLVDWQPFEGCVTGMLSAGLGVADNGPVLQLGVEIHQRR